MFQVSLSSRNNVELQIEKGLMHPGVHKIPLDILIFAYFLFSPTASTRSSWKIRDKILRVAQVPIFASLSTNYKLRRVILLAAHQCPIVTKVT